MRGRTSVLGSVNESRGEEKRWMLMTGLGKYDEGVSRRDLFVWATVATVNDLRLTELEIMLPIIPEVCSSISENDNYRK
jgi:hypothetical protein